MNGMSHWPTTRVTLLDRLRDPQDREAWSEFVDLYGPLLLHFARRRLPQDEDAADVVQDVLGAVMRGSYQRSQGRFQKWLVTVLLNRIRDFHSARCRRPEVSGGTTNAERLLEEPSRGEEDEWERERQQHLFRIASERVRTRTSPLHWDVFARTALDNQTGRDLARELNLSPANVYTIRSRIMKEIRAEIERFGEEWDDRHYDINPDSTERSTMAPCIHIERMNHRSSIAVSGESTAGYTLVKLIPSGLSTATPMGLNLALALDVSGSMYEEDGTGKSRLQRVQEAAIAALDRLRPDDTLTVVAFAHNAQMLLPPTPVAEKPRIEEVLRRIDRFNVDPGGTAMDEGLALALEAVEKHAGPGKLSQIVVLTDGETSGEQNCRSLAQQAAARNVPLTFMGVGVDWNASLIKDLAKASQGKWYYIDVNAREETARVFAEEFETLAATAFLDVEMQLRPMKDVHIKRVRQVVPEIRELGLEEQQERCLVARLGTLPGGVSSRYILDLDLPGRPDGKYLMAQLELTYDSGDGRQSSGPIPLEINYTASGNGYVNAEVMKHIDELELKSRSDTLRNALESNDRQTAEAVAHEMVEMGKLMGPGAKRKTQLAEQVLDELNQTGVVRKATQLSLESEARVGQVSG
jgi:RNA polymerase sigma factor (sigma-70 family)